MSVLNKIIKHIANIVTHIGVAIYLYLISMLLTSPILVITLTIINIVTKSLPACVIQGLWLVFLIASIPIWLILFVILIKDKNKKIKNKNVQNKK